MKELLNKKFSKFLEYFFIRLFITFFKLIPFRLNIFITQRIGLLLYYFAKQRKKLIQDNIRYAFPEKSEEWVINHARESFMYTSRVVAEVLATQKLKNPYFFKKWVGLKPEFYEHQKILKNGGIFIMGHIGSWEWHGHVGSILCEHDIYTFAQRQSNPWFNHYIEKVRNKAGIQIIYTDENPLKLLSLVSSLLKKNKVVAFISDQYSASGEYIPFMNRLASTATGPALFAGLNQAAPVYFASSYRDEKGRLIFEMNLIERPQSINFRKSKQEWQRIFTLNWVKILENKIRSHPKDYFWVHNRWKNPPKNSEEIWKLFR